VFGEGTVSVFSELAFGGLRTRWASHVDLQLSAIAPTAMGGYEARLQAPGRARPRPPFASTKTPSRRCPIQGAKRGKLRVS